MADYIKRARGAPAGLFEAEAAGLEWLAQPGFVSVAEPYEVGRTFLRMERIATGAPNAEAAHRFGAGLARLHGAGAPAFGYTPSDHAFFGPLESPFALQRLRTADFTEFWSARLGHVASLAARGLGEAWRGVQDAIDAVGSGVFAGIAGGDPEPPARVHGDLWSGNLIWAGAARQRTHAVLIDPCAHGGHPLEDLALLELFGAPYLDVIFTGYEAQRRQLGRGLPTDWRRDLPVHLFFALLAHVHLFGSGFTQRTAQVAQQIVARADELR